MTKDRYTSLKRLAQAGCLFVCLSGPAFAQTDEASPEQPPEGESSDTGMDEIVVTAEKPGDKSVETPYEELLRQRVLEEYDRMAREQEELAWRQKPGMSDPSRINFGYRPQDQRRDDAGSAFNSLPMDQVKPATVFRFEF